MYSSKNREFGALVLWRVGWAVIALVALSAVTSASAVAQVKYTVTDLGTLGGTFGFAHGVNNRGQVAGFATLAGDTAQNAFFWQNGRKIEIPSAFGGPDSNAFYRPSERGQVAGQAESSTPDPNGENFCGDGPLLVCLPFVWRKGVISPLPLLVGGNNGAAYAVNNRSQVAGQSEIGTPDPTCGTPPPPPFFIFLETRAVIWENGQVQALAILPGDTQANALAINDVGQAVGVSGDCFAFQGGLASAVLWQNGTVTDLGNLGGSLNNLALNINNLGEVVGFSDLSSDTAENAFLWQNGGPMINLGVLPIPGHDNSFAVGINDKSQVVGSSFDSVSGDQRAFLWQDGVMTDVNTLIPSESDLFLLLAADINARGQIVGAAFQLSGCFCEIHAFLLNPVSGTTASTGAAPLTSGRAALPENIRRQLRQRFGLGRFMRGLTRP